VVVTETSKLVEAYRSLSKFQISIFLMFSIENGIEVCRRREKALLVVSRLLAKILNFVAMSQLCFMLIISFLDF
jgi:hypothetical protein